MEQCIIKITVETNDIEATTVSEIVTEIVAKQLTDSRINGDDLEAIANHIMYNDTDFEGFFDTISGQLLSQYESVKYKIESCQCLEDLAELFNNFDEDEWHYCNSGSINYPVFGGDEPSGTGSGDVYAWDEENVLVFIPGIENPFRVESREVPK